MPEPATVSAGIGEALGDGVTLGGLFLALQKSCERMVIRLGGAAWSELGPGGAPCRTSRA